MDSTSCEKSGCPVMGGFCWKNPTHWVFALAILPFTVKGLALIANWVHSVISAVAGN